ncbi:MAG: T9SS type A sorting domain-containing protein [Sphingobacteriales bacterium]|nr:MAG: T9SS type A sorting domain-containing protein [Sphingobacteriales bacterium]
MTLSSNMGSLTVRVISKDGVMYGSPLVPNTAVGGVYTFTDLGPGIYVLRSSENICNTFVYDTVRIYNYQFPNLNRSSAYQCDQGGFSVSAVATHGVAPFTYEIIGSVPSFPSIVSAPQSSSIFSINNGSTYSLIRLRALDACGNATLGDASILPLTNYGIRASMNCLFYPTTLSVDTIINASYDWYKKVTLTATDSTSLGNGPGVFIPNLLPSDTGYYVCYVNVNGGCIKRRYNYHLTGSCYIVLPVTLEEFKGRKEREQHMLSWKTTQEQNMQNYVVERQTDNEPFTEIGRTVARGSSSSQQYQLFDASPQPGNNFYRLKMNNTDGSYTYSNIVLLQKEKSGISYSIYPNPVKDILNIHFSGYGGQHYTVSMFTMSNQLVLQQNYSTASSNHLEIHRPASTQPGMYLLRIVNTATNEQVTQKIIFL